MGVLRQSHSVAQADLELTGIFYVTQAGLEFKAALLGKEL